MHALIRWIVLSAGWPRRLTALVAGAVGALALAPVDVPIAMLVPMSIAVWLIDGAARGERPGLGGRLVPIRSIGAAAAVGWWWGVGYFLAGFWWLGAAFLVEPEKNAWAMPLGVFGVPVMLAVFPALGFGLARWLWGPGAGRIFSLTAGLGISEWMRGTLFTGFPWNNYGMALGDSLVLSQSASVVGNTGLTLLAIAICAAPATLADPLRRPRGALPRQLAPTICAALAVCGLAGFGLLWLSHDQGGTVPGVKLRIVQPNVAQDAAFSYANKDKIVADYLELSDRATSPDRSGLADITHVIWPESAFPFILARDPDALDAIGRALPAGTLLITGAARIGEPAPGSSGRDPAYYNAIQVIGSGGTILDSYDKVHLVPFGEYLPLDGLLRRLGVSHFVHIPGGFQPGLRHRLLDVPGLPPASPLICYEVIFPGETLPRSSSPERLRAGLILNVTNDGWFGQTAGPYQHFAQARLRSVEYGLPLVRSANTGISAVVDPYGRVVASLPLGTRNVLDSNLPNRIQATIYSRGAWLIEPLVYSVSVLLALVFGCLRRQL